MEPTTTTQDAPVAPATPAEPTAPPPQDEPAQQQTTDQVAAPEQTTEATPVTDTTSASQEAPVETATEDDVQQFNPVAPVPPLDFSQLPTDENNLIDPNALAQQINQRIAMAEQNATQRAQQIYAEQEQEKRLWEKTYDKYPDLKNNKELQSLVQQARIGEATDILSRARTAEDAAAAKLPTPSQIADRLFKHLGTAKTEGMQQAQVNTVIQKSAQLETAGRKSDVSADSVAQARSNLNNPNKQIADKARSELLKNYLGWNN